LGSKTHYQSRDYADALKIPRESAQQKIFVEAVVTSLHRATLNAAAAKIPGHLLEAKTLLRSKRL
jgi:hypothetical protein